MNAWITLLLTLAPIGAESVEKVDPDERDARKIMQAVFDRERGDRWHGRSRMVIRDDSGERGRAFEMWALEFAEGTRTLMLFESPADIRNTGLLTVDYDDGGRQDDQWLYLPSLHRATRISQSGKSGSFMGSDLSYADLTQRDPDDYEFSLLEPKVDVSGESCWLIEARPKANKALEETGYVKSHVYVSKEKLIPVQAKAWLKEGRKLKYFRTTDIRRIDDIWTGFRTVVRLVRNGKLESETTLEILDVHYGRKSGVDARDVSQERLEQGL